MTQGQQKAGTHLSGQEGGKDILLSDEFEEWQSCTEHVQLTTCAGFACMASVGILVELGVLLSVQDAMRNWWLPNTAQTDGQNLVKLSRSTLNRSREISSSTSNGISPPSSTLTRQQCFKQNTGCGAPWFAIDPFCCCVPAARAAAFSSGNWSLDCSPLQDSPPQPPAAAAAPRLHIGQVREAVDHTAACCFLLLCLLTTNAVYAHFR